jgi:hypothetical protein
VTLRVTCPFLPCAASVELIIEQAQADDDELTVKRVKSHKLHPETWYGHCPASLTLYPTSPGDLQRFNSALFHLHNMRKDRARAEAEAEPSEPVPPPKERPPDTWFRANNGGDTGRLGPGLRGFARLFLPNNQPNRTTEGGAVASVEEVKAAIAQASTVLAEGQELIRGGEGKLTEGAAILEWIAAQATADVGQASAHRAADEARQAREAAGRAIDTARGYGASL